MRPGTSETRLERKGQVIPEIDSRFKNHHTVGKGDNTMYRWLFLIGLILLVVLAGGSAYAWDGHGRSSGHSGSGHGYQGHGGYSGHGYSGHGYRGHGGYSAHGYWGRGWGGHGYSGHGYQGHGGHWGPRYQGYGWGGPRFYSPWSLLIPPLPIPVPVPAPPFGCEPY